MLNLLKKLIPTVLVIFLSLSIPLGAYASSGGSNWGNSSGGSNWGNSSGGSNWGITADDLARKANQARGNTGLVGENVPSSVVTEAAAIFVGPGHTVKMDNGGFWFYSKDGLKRVRTGQKIGAGVYQANFELFSKTGYNDLYRVTNYHVTVK